MHKKTAFVFPGQGSQSAGMGFSLASRFEDFNQIYSKRLSEADQILGFKISKLMSKGPETELKKTEITQPALLTLSCAMADWLQQNQIEADMALGHSLGEYSALVYAGSLEFSDAVRLVHLRGKFMSEAVPNGVGGMAALLGASRAEAEEICKTFSNEQEVLEVSVVNSCGQVVVSGHSSAIQKVAEKSETLGLRKVVTLEVSGPFHCSLLKSAGDKLAAELSRIQMKDPKIPVISNVTAKPQGSINEIKMNLVAQVSKTVLWEESIREAHEEKVEDFVEIGSGKVLTGLIKKILPDARCTPLDSIQKLELLKAA